MDKKEKTRQLLDKFYRGETTLEENLLIAEILSESDDEATAVDKKLFDALAGAVDTTVPAGLESRIKTAIAESSGKHRIKPVVWWRATGIAAAVAITFAFGWRLLNIPETQINEAPKLIAEVKDMNVDTSESHPTVILSAEQAQKLLEPAPKPVRKVKKVNNKVSTEEAVLAAEASLRLLGERMNDAARKVIEASEQMEQIDNSLKNILQ
ncbi:MAG: hypothetical protein K2M11_06835 [Paramuribaculum sp.]|nr:hypothetical protein [Paramuribaculum sp.]